MIDLKQGDCLELMKEIPDKSVDAIVTDPPYLYLNSEFDKAFDESAVFAEWLRVLKPDSLVAFFGRGESFYRWNYLLNQAGFKFKEDIIWEKNRISSPLINLGRIHENVSILGLGKGKIRKRLRPYVEVRANNTRGVQQAITDVKRVASATHTPNYFDEIVDYIENGNMIFNRKWETKKAFVAPKTKENEPFIATLKGFGKGLKERDVIKVNVKHTNRFHPTEKPVELMKRLVALVSDEQATILDPFMGSGSTGVACVNTKRDFIGMELDEEYFHIAEKRIQEAQSEIRLDV